MDPKRKEVDVIDAKLLDLQTPGFEAEMTPAQADVLGAFVEDAISARDAEESAGDMEEEVND